jgi:serine/threonine protein kinase
MVDIRKLGRYEVVRVLGKGAMGVVYEGRDPNLDRQVAIKTIRVQSLSAEATQEYDGRFRTEARSAARLHHPNIVSVFDSGQDGDTSYLVMEFIEGQDLKYHLENGARFSVRASIVLVHDLLMALDHAHRQNVVHRDIKPANMLIELSGRVKLTDFGVARIQEPDETQLTKVGGAVGTPKYMSPEQAKGLRGDSRSDVFSAGVVLYELLTGVLPFDGENQFAVIHKIVGHDPPPPSTLNPDVPTAMDEVMARAMTKNPDERYATAREFGLALREVAQQIGAATGNPGADVAAELSQIMANRPSISLPAALRDGSSTGIFGPAADVSLVTTVNYEEELGIWNSVKDSTVAQNFLDYLQRFPAGMYVRRAQQRLEQLALDNTDTRARTEPQFRPQVRQEGLDATTNTFPSTVPSDDTHTQPAFKTKALVGSPAVPMAGVESATSPKPAPLPPPQLHPQPTPPRRKLWPAVAVGGAVCGAVVLGLVFRPITSVEPALLPAIQTPLAAVDEKAPTVPMIEESASDSVEVTAKPVAAASKSVAAIPATLAKVSRPTMPKPSLKLGSDTLAAPNATPSASVAPRESTPIASPRSIASGVGPSAAGQVCGDKMFIFRIACVAEQCKSDRFRQTGECLRFKEMEKKREDERNFTNAKTP